MKKYSIVLLALVVAVIAAFYFWTALLARKKSDSIASKFKEVDTSLHFSTDSTQIIKGVGAVQRIYPISELKSRIVLLIDSLREKLEKIPESSGKIEVPKSMQSDLTRLLHDVQRLNKIMWDMTDSRIPDTIKYWPGSDNFSEKEWHSTIFVNTPKEGMITYLNYLRNQTLAINSDASY